MKIYVIDGQGGRMGKAIVEQIKARRPGDTVIAVGTNSIATAAMLKAGADAGATGENPVIVACREADVIIGPIGIVLADALYGEVTPAMARAIASCKAKKLLLPVNRCTNHVVGVQDLSLSELTRLTVLELDKMDK